MFITGMWYNKVLQIKIMVSDSGDVYIMSDKLPLSLRTTDVLNADNWEEVDE